MATGGSRFDDKQYINWIAATLALMYMKEGLETFIENQATRLHNTLLTLLGSAPQSCKNNCTCAEINKDSRNRRWCMDCSLCDDWLQNVISFHINAPFPNISPENTDPQLWLTEPWESIKLFIPYGCATDNSSEDTDVQGMLSLFNNCTHFSTGGHIGRHDLLRKLQDLRNALIHSPNFKVTATDVKDHLKTINDFLQGMSGSLTKSEQNNIDNAIKNVNQLQKNPIEISMNKELELKALQQKQITLDRDLKSLRDKVNVIHEEHDSQNTEIKHHKQILKELETAKERFDEFLEQNDLVNDKTKLSKKLTDIDQRIRTIEEQFKLKAPKVTFEENDSAVERGHLSKQVADIDKRVRLLEKQVKTQLEGGVKDLETQCKELHTYLLGVYESIETSLLSKMYFKTLDICLRTKDEHGTLAVNNHYELRYDRIFMVHNEMCENIYISGEAGVGKTTFCNKIIRDWCRVAQNIPTPELTFDEQKVFSYFKLLFFISLRNFETVYSIEDMIQEQIGSDFNISEILKSERCLVILDGLDEWKCPDIVKQFPGANKDIPGRGTANKKCVFITTTSHLKFDSIALDSKHLDTHIRLSGINNILALQELVEKFLNHVTKFSGKRQKNTYLLKKFSPPEIGALMADPGRLALMVTLWYAGRDVGTSQTQLICRTLEFLFERFEKDLSKQTSKCSSVQQTELPDVFITMTLCQNNAELLHSLAKVGYETLFNKQKEERFAFKSPKLESVCMSPSDIEFCLKCGILRKDNEKVSFVQKRVHQFFAALFLVLNENNDVMKDINEVCYSLETMLEMKQVWQFVAGMDPDITRRLLEHLTNVVSADEHVMEYRKTLVSNVCSECYRLTEIQRCVSVCLSEGINNEHLYKNICLEDLIIDLSTRDDICQLLLSTDILNIKSLYICTKKMCMSACEWATTTGHIEQCHSLQKLAISDHKYISDLTVTTLVDNNFNSLTSLYWDTDCTATEKLVTAICNAISESLMALRLTGLILTHALIDKLLNSLSESHVIRELNLGFKCENHGPACKPRIDWSATRLRELDLRFMCDVNLQLLPHCMEKLTLACVTLPVTSLRDYALRLTKTRREVTVKLLGITLLDLKKDDCEDLDVFFMCCRGLLLTKFDNMYDNWDIEFHTNSNESQ